MNGTPLAVAVRGLTKRFGATVALDDVDLDLPAGSVTGVVGFAGAGKTTLVRMLAGLARPPRGSVSVTERESSATLRGTALRRRMGFLPSSPAFYDWMTGRELLQLVGRLLDLSGAELDAEVDAAITAGGLEDDADLRISGYGLSARQRLGFAQAVIGHPGLLLLDEPLASLDADARAETLGRVASLRGACTVVLATDHLEDVASVCDRLAVLDDGHLVASGATADLLGRVAGAAYRVGVDPGQEPGVRLLADALRRQAWVRGVAVDGQGLRVVAADPELGAMRLLPILGTSGLRVRAVAREPVSLERLLAALQGDPAGTDTAARHVGVAAEAAR